MLRRPIQRGFSLVALLFCAAMSAQSNRSSTFHVSGTIMRFGSPVGNDRVAFEGPSQKSVRADPNGHYEADLPLGVWKVTVMTSFASGITESSRLSHPRVFRVTRPMNIHIDLYVNAVGCGGVMVITRDGGPPTPQDVEAKNEACQGRELFPMPSDDGVPFEIVIGGRNHVLCSIPHENRAACEREFGTFNLLTVYADKVGFTRFPNGALLEARGNVVVENGNREYRKDSARFLINNGQAVEAY